MKVKNLIRDLIQLSYIMMFFLTTLSIAGNIEQDRPISRNLIIAFVISAFLSYGKIIYLHITEKED